MIARLPDEQLRVLAGWNEEISRSPVATAGRAATPDSFMEAALEAVGRLDSREFEALLMRASLELGSQGLLQKLIAPLAQRLGDLWQTGEVTAAEEHFASGLMRGFLTNLARPFALPEHAPTLVVATPSGQLHELGAVLVAAAASGHGWRVAYLGTGLPAVEIAGTAVRTGARAVALSIVYPTDDPNLSRELVALRRYLPGSVTVVAGGRAAAAYHTSLEEIGATTAGSLSDLSAILDGIRLPRVAGSGAN
jgi:methanogenic corrinoid protein MtbC1